MGLAHRLASKISNLERARAELGWEPRIDFESLVKLMVEHDLAVEAPKADL